jgi:hypothetical protein
MKTKTKSQTPIQNQPKRKTKTQNKPTTTETTPNKNNCAALFQKPKIPNHGIHHQTTSQLGKPPPKKHVVVDYEKSLRRL